MTKVCVKVKKPNVTILKSGLKFNWSRSVPGQKNKSTFRHYTTRFLNKNIGNELIAPIVHLYDFLFSVSLIFLKLFSLVFPVRLRLFVQSYSHDEIWNTSSRWEYIKKVRYKKYFQQFTP